jgi:uncharacterized membrane protein YdjX (TVP38/TMEM64 family)
VLTSLLLIALLAVALWVLFRTDAGGRIRSDPRNFARETRDLAVAHPVKTPLVYLALYTTLAVLALPIWWLQILGGVGLGIYEGTFVSLLGSTLATGIAVALSRWIAADWFHQRIETKLDRLRKLDEALGHNGLFFVVTVRLIPLLPFGLFNYALGLSQISFLDALLGTFLGATPVIALHVGVGAGYDPLRDWTFDLVLTSITLILLLPLILRYLKPEWFRKIGVE